MNKVFAFDAPAFEIVKSYKDPNGQMYIEGIAATTGIDLTGERMSPEVIAKMAARLVGKPLRSEHGKGWDDKIGTIQEADVRNDEMGQPALWIKARLNDWSSKARDLFGLLKTEGVKMGLSVAGKINPGGLVREMVESLGKYIPTYKDVEPTEVSITDHPANLQTFAYAVAKSLHLDEDYHYDPDEFNKTDRPATIEDLAHLAQAVQNEFKKQQEGVCDHEKCAEHQKCMSKDCAYKCEKCQEMYDASYSKDDGVMTFLDTEKNRYPADDKHLMPLLRYFNGDGQRDADGYDDEKWAEMGKNLAVKLSTLTGDSYSYNQKSEKVVKEGLQKDENEKEVNDMNNKHGNLVSKTIPQDVKGLLKSWGKDGDAEEASVQKTEGVKVDDVKKVDEMKKDSKPELFTPGGDSSSTSSTTSGDGSSSSGSSDSSSSDSSSSDSSSSDSSSSSGSMSSELESLMSELKSTLEALKDSMSGSGSSSSDSSSSDSSDGSSDSSSGSSDKTSTDKAMDASSTSSESSSSDQDEVARAIDTLVQAASTMREALAKKKPSLAGQSSEEASEDSTSTNVTGDSAKKANPANGDQHPKGVGDKPKLPAQSSEEATDTSSSANVTAKALTEALSLMKEMQKSLAKRDEEFSKLVEKSEEETPSRKGYAWALEKKFDGYHDADGTEGVDADMLKKISEDKTISFQEYYTYKHYGKLPKKYAEMAKS